MDAALESSLALSNCHCSVPTESMQYTFPAFANATVTGEVVLTIAEVVFTESLVGKIATNTREVPFTITKDWLWDPTYKRPLLTDGTLRAFGIV
jgi:hypothetical protein